MIGKKKNEGGLGKPYVLITPARNEEKYIEETIKAVVKQTALPKKWVIVNDGSVDGTAKIVKRYEERYEFLKMVNSCDKGRRNFGSKVQAFNAGFKIIEKEKYDFIGNLDADVTFGEKYYEEILKRFEENLKMGIAGGIVFENINGRYVSQSISLNSVAGAIQLFRRSCYEEIGGYIPIKTGGIDAAAEISARARGWDVRTFSEIHVLHHRRVKTGGKSILNTKFYQGMGNYRLGYHPFFQLISCIKRMISRPYLVGSILIMGGYIWAFLRGEDKILAPDVRKFLQEEQMERIRSLLSGRERKKGLKELEGRGLIH